MEGTPIGGRSPNGTGKQSADAVLLSLYVAAIVQRQNAGLWHRMSWVRTPLAAPLIGPASRVLRDRNLAAHAAIALCRRLLPMLTPLFPKCTPTVCQGSAK